MPAPFLAQVSCYSTQRAEKSYFPFRIGRRGSELGLWQSCRCAPVQLLATSTIMAKVTHSDPRLPKLQIAKERFLRVHLTELYKMRPEPKKGAHYYTRAMKTLNFLKHL